MFCVRDPRSMFAKTVQASVLKNHRLVGGVAQWWSKFSMPKALGAISRTGRSCSILKCLHPPLFFIAFLNFPFILLQTKLPVRENLNLIILMELRKSSFNHRSFLASGGPGKWIPPCTLMQNIPGLSSSHALLHNPAFSQPCPLFFVRCCTHCPSSPSSLSGLSNGGLLDCPQLA